ncbi:uncharacterized protein MYCFIDRAFT_213654 [Pseudocercospora fijiensis CIRAD86]|uniref:Prolyl 4-hydroxylase alpha subunit Fe(2+) 2OG dioxygenase domain-containing protein n=1 Tax=Pseudocercospora fijiensis (strain CIRAD86) TaxID=383855 RepID=N1QCJ6_PSEFD|nr:uncharacterized protein MYCFIDRAFT_213654 [Pseudocercospora fijiensis CIRAD86]EME89412.1 hypothetical protein MYCFIDRAFT_213654 [Pseudocercospora fijiensis CIRAD86]
MSDISQSDLFAGDRWAWARAMNGEQDEADENQDDDEEDEDENSDEDEDEDEAEESAAEDDERSSNEDSGEVGHGSPGCETKGIKAGNGESRNTLAGEIPPQTISASANVQWPRPAGIEQQQPSRAADTHTDTRYGVTTSGVWQNGVQVARPAQKQINQAAVVTDPAQHFVPQEEANQESDVDYGLSESDVRASLQQALDAVQNFGTFASFGPIEQFWDPVITVAQGGPPITLPLQEQDAQRLIAASHKAPFGKGSETIVDDNVRKTWELNTNEFMVNNPYFNGTVNHAVTNAVSELGVTNLAQVGISPYKMLLYEPGAMFKPHTDTEKVPGMFATLVICLPSAHEGGDIVLSHKGAMKRFATSATQPSYACWYSDVTHEVKEVASGYRLVLTYNIYKTSAMASNFSASQIGEQYPELKSALKNWRWVDSSPAVYILDHKYTDAHLNINSLKGADVARVQALSYFAERYKYEIFLASMEHMKHGEAAYEYDPYDRYGSRRGRYNDWYDDDDDDEDEDDDGSDGEFHAIEDIHETETKLKRVIAPDGTQLITDMTIEEDCLLFEEAFQAYSRDPDDEDYTGFTGNEGAQSTHWYRDTRLKQTRTSTQDVNLRARSDLVQLCKFVVKENQSILGRTDFAGRPLQPAFSPRILSHVFGLLGQLKEYHALADAVASTSGPINNEALKRLSPMINTKFDKVQNALTEAFAKIRGVNSTFEALKALFGGDINNRAGPAAEWASGILTKAVSNVSNPSEQDGRALIHIAVSLKRRGFLENCNRTHFVLAFLAALIMDGEDAFEVNDVLAGVRRCIGPMIEGFFLEVSEERPSKRHKTVPEAGSATVSTQSKTGDELNEVLDFLVTKDVKVEAESLFAALELQVRACKTDVLRKILVPFLEASQLLANAHSKTDYGPMFRSLYRNTLEAYVERFVKDQPPAYENLARSRVNCSCQDCWKLNLCLISTTQQECRLRVSSDRRHHLHDVLDRSGFDGTHETDRRSDTLVVRKRSKGKQAFDAWFARCQEAGEVLKQFDAATLKDMLGRRYERIVEMRMLISDESNVPEVMKVAAGSSGALAETASPRVQAGVKRKAEVIDLVGDSSD